MKKGWTKTNFGSLGRVFNGNSISENEKSTHYAGVENGIPYIGTKDVGFDCHIQYDSGVKIPPSRRDGFKLAPANSVLVCAEGGSAGRKIAHTDSPIYFGNKLFAICPNPETSSRFVFYYCLSDDFSEAFRGSMAGLIGGVSLNKFKDLGIELPPLSEQQRIVALLDEAFAGLATAQAHAERNLRNARALFESHLNAVFTQRGEGWKLKTLEEVAATFGRGKSKHRPRNEPKLYGGRWPFVQTGDIRNANHIVTEYSQTYSEAGLAQSKLWPKGTICITIAANIAETAILGFDACFPDSVIGVVANPDEAEVGFIEYLLQSFKARIQSLGKGSAQANINLGTFENERFPFPSIAEQKKIVVKLDVLSEETQRLTRLYEQKLAALAALKQSFLHQAFSGEF